MFEVSNILTSLNIYKSERPNSIPRKILKTYLGNWQSFSYNLFLLEYFLEYLHPKIMGQYAKKECSKLDCSNYKPIFLLSNTDKITEYLMYNRLYHFPELLYTL